MRGWGQAGPAAGEQERVSPAGDACLQVCELCASSSTPARQGRDAPWCCPGCLEIALQEDGGRREQHAGLLWSWVHPDLPAGLGRAVLPAGSSVCSAPGAFPWQMSPCPAPPPAVGFALQNKVTSSRKRGQQTCPEMSHWGTAGSVCFIRRAIATAMVSIAAAAMGAVFCTPCPTASLGPMAMRQLMSDTIGV